MAEKPKPPALPPVPIGKRRYFLDVGSERYYIDVSGKVRKEKIKQEFAKLMDGLDKKAEPKKLLNLPDMTSFEIFNYLQLYLWYQDPALTKVSHAFYDHMLKIKDYIKNGENLEREEEIDVVLQVGGTGVGKSETMRRLSKIMNVPYVHATAEQFTSAGYVGRDVETLLKEVIEQAKDMGDEKIAEYAIIHIDEIDKIITEGAGSKQRDVGGEAVQEALLKLLDKGEVSIEFKKGNEIEIKKVGTKNMFFVLSGAFDGDGKTEGVEQIIKERVYSQEAKTGFLADVRKKKDLTVEERKDLLYQITNEDLSKYRGKGMIRQLQSRISTIVVYPSYTAEELSDIFEKPKNSLMDQTKWAFERWGIKLDYTEEAIKILGEEAEKLNTGARGLKSVVSRFRDRYGFILSNIEAKSLKVTGGIIRNPEGMLEKVVEHALKEKFSKESDFKLNEVKCYINSNAVYKEFSKKIIETNTAVYKDLMTYLKRKVKKIEESFMNEEIKELPELKITSNTLKELTHNL